MRNAVWQDYYLNPCPPDDLVGWCHNCETWQRGRDKTVGVVKRRDGSVGFSFGCTNGCHMEAWDMGIWTCSCSDHNKWAEDTDPEDPDWRISDEPCWHDLYGEQADHQCSVYIGEPCPHEVG